MNETKKLLVTLVVAAFCWVSYGQGTVAFSNRSFPGGGVNAPVYQFDGVTLLSGPQFMAELLAGPSADNLAFVAATGFLTDTGAGYFNGGTPSISTVFPRDTAWVQVDVWNTASGASFVQARASGLPNSWWQSSIFSVPTGGGGVNPFPPGLLVGLGNSPVFLNGATVPEPSAAALVMTGAVVVLIYLRSTRAARATVAATRKSTAL